MLPITLRQLQYLAAIADSGTISAAADQCQVSAVAVRQGLIDLERTLGHTLTLRQRAKGVTLTPEGKVALRHAHNILREVSQLPLSIDMETQRARRKLRVGVFSSLSTWMIPPLLKFLAAEHPDVQLEYVEGDIDLIKKCLNAGDIDVFIANHNQLREDVDKLQEFPIREVQPYILVSEHHRLAHYPGVRFSDLQQENFVLLSLNPAKQRMVEVLDTYDLSANVQWESRNVETVNGIVGSGLAIALQFSFGTDRTSLDGEKLVSVPVLDPMPSNTAVACIPADADISPLVRSAIDHLQLLYRQESGAPS